MRPLGVWRPDPARKAGGPGEGVQAAGDGCAGRASWGAERCFEACAQQELQAGLSARVPAGSGVGVGGAEAHGHASADTRVLTQPHADAAWSTQAQA